MLAKRANKKSTEDGDDPRQLPRWAVWAVSALLIAHLTVVVATPLTLGRGSALTTRIVGFAAPYLQAGNVSHYYAFFAPNPGPAHIIKYELIFENGRTEEGKFPDLGRHWPRLLYHRHFMLSDQLGDPGPDPRGPVPRGPVEDGSEVVDDDAEYQQWFESRNRFMRQVRSYATHLLKVHKCKEVRLHYFEHNIPTREAVLDGVRLDEDGSYIPYPLDPLVVITAEDES